MGRSYIPTAERPTTGGVKAEVGTPTFLNGEGEERGMEGVGRVGKAGGGGRGVSGRGLRGMGVKGRWMQAQVLTPQHIFRLRESEERGGEAHSHVGTQIFFPSREGEERDGGGLALA